MASKVFDEIKKMSLMEIMDLVNEIKDEFGISDIAPVAAAPAAAADASAGPAEEKTEFKVELKDIGAEKIKVIKALRTVTSLALKEAKEKVESAPCTLAESVSKEEADKMKKALEEAGAKVELS